MFPDIPTDIFKPFNDAVDNFWAKRITLFYPEIREECSNCYYNGMRSNGTYKTGGPYPFENGSICPYCGGEGLKTTEPSETLTARIYYDRKNWVDVGAKVNVPDAAAQIIFKMTELPKIQQCKYIIPEYYEGINAYQNQRLFRIGDYYPQGFTQNPIKYVTTFWSHNV